mmetsp:Transcript_93009/g.277665  ORF Transcript_93009/g.277665 Transcript_93009/m.277665 type:complete len:251 (-) Transcript_93009:294-1046(-)
MRTEALRTVTTASLAMPSFCASFIESTKAPVPSPQSTSVKGPAVDSTTFGSSATFTITLKPLEVGLRPLTLMYFGFRRHAFFMCATANAKPSLAASLTLASFSKSPRTMKPCDMPSKIFTEAPASLISPWSFSVKKASPVTDMYSMGHLASAYVSLVCATPWQETAALRRPLLAATSAALPPQQKPMMANFPQPFRRRKAVLSSTSVLTFPQKSSDVISPNHFVNSSPLSSFLTSNSSAGQASMLRPFPA